MDFIILKYWWNWYKISHHQNLTEEFIDKYANKIRWHIISQIQKLSEELIKKHADKVDWSLISRFQKLSEKFIEENSINVDWDFISRYQKLSEEFIEKHSDKVNWYCISIYKKLSEKFIEKYSNKVYWEFMSQYQKLSEDLIEKHSDKVNWNNIKKYQKLSPGFMKKYNLKIPAYSWMYWDNEKKEKYIRENCPEYDIIDGEVIAYKATRIDGCSVYDFRYFYEIGKEYSAHADCNSNEYNSFGLSAWSREKALEYYDEGKLFKVGIKLEDLACIVENSHKIRARKLRIISEEDI